MTILDIGCGPGTITIDLAKNYVPQGRVVGVEPPSGVSVLDTASKAANDAGVKNAEFLTADVHDLKEFEDGSFDVVHSHQLLQHVGDPILALSEMYRVTRKGGGIIASRCGDIDASAWYPPHPQLTAYSNLHTRLTQHNGGEPNAGRMLHVWAKKASIPPSAITCSASAWCRATKEEREWWAFGGAERVVKSDFARQAVEGGFATKEELENIAKGWREWGQDEDGWYMSPQGEIICLV